MSEETELAKKCVTEVGEVLNKHGFAITVDHIVVPTKDSNSRIVFDVEHHLRFVKIKEKGN